MIRVTVSEATGNHGCTQHFVAEFPSPRSKVGVVVEAYGCTSCWQVGHDKDNAEQYEYMVGSNVYLEGMSAKSFAAYVEGIDSQCYGELAEDCPSIGHYYVAD